MTWRAPPTEYTLFADLEDGQRWEDHSIQPMAVVLEAGPGIGNMTRAPKSPGRISAKTRTPSSRLP